MKLKYVCVDITLSITLTLLMHHEDALAVTGKNPIDVACLQAAYAYLVSRSIMYVFHNFKLITFLTLIETWFFC